MDNVGAGTSRLYLKDLMFFERTIASGGCWLQTLSAEYELGLGHVLQDFEKMNPDGT